MPCLLESCRYVLDCVRVFAQLAPRVLPGVADPSLYAYRLLLFYQVFVQELVGYFISTTSTCWWYMPCRDPSFHDDVSCVDLVVELS